MPPLPEGEGREGVLGWLHSVARSHVDVALEHRPVLIANALGSPPVDVIEQAHAHGVKVAALAGAAKHALSHVQNGVDIIVAQGYEAGGHTGEIASMVLTPEIVDAVGPDVPVLGAGGIGSRPPDGGLAGAGRAGRVDRLDLAHRRGVRTSPATRACRDAFLRADVVRHRADPDLHRQAGPAAQDQVDRGVGARRTRRTRCRCRCRTCSSPTRTTG